MSKKTLKLDIPDQDNVLMSPLDLRVSYQTPKSEMDLLPFLDLVMIGFLFFILSSRLVYTPGVAVDLPNLDSAVLSPTVVTDVMTVSTRNDNSLFFFKDSIYDLEGLGELAKGDLVKSRENSSILLVKMDSNLSVQLQMDIVAFAKEMGYEKVQVAVDPSE